MISRFLKSEKLQLNLGFLDDAGKLAKRTQKITFMAPDATDEEKYNMSISVGTILVSPPKSIENIFSYELLEA